MPQQRDIARLADLVTTTAKVVAEHALELGRINSELMRVSADTSRVEAALTSIREMLEERSQH